MGYLYLGSEKITPFVFENEGGGGRTIEALNISGYTIKPNEKVWINEDFNGVLKTINTNLTSSRATHILSANGNFSYKINSSSGSKVDIHTLDYANETFITNNADYAVYYYYQLVYLSNGFPVRTYGPLPGSSSSTRKSLILLNNGALINIENVICPGNIVTDNTNYRIYKYDIETNAVDPTKYVISQNLATYYKNSHTICYLDKYNEIYIFSTYSTRNRYRYGIPDWENHTITYTEKTNIITNTCYYPIGVTSDNKYILCTLDTEFQFNTNQCIRLYTRVDTGILQEVSDVPLEMQKWLVSGNKSRTFNFNPANNILICCENGLEKNIEVFKYDSINNTWILQNIDFGSIIPDDYPYVRNLTMSLDENKIAFTCKDTEWTENANAYTYAVQLVSSNKWELINFSKNTVNQNSITGIAKGTISPGQIGEVSIL